MRKIILISLLLFSSLFAFQYEKDVLVLHDSDFPGILQQYPNLLIQFYAPWCGHCKSLAPIYDEVATQLKQKGSSIYLAKVDATEQKTSSNKYQIKGFPTLLFFINGQPIPFKGSRTKDGIINWLQKKLKPALGNIDNMQELESLNTKTPASIIYYGSNPQQIQRLNSIALVDEENNYYLATGQISNHKPHGTVEIHRVFDQIISTQQINDNLKGWIAKYSQPPVRFFDQKMISAIFSDGKPALILYNVNNDDILTEILTKVSKKYEGSVLFCQIRKQSEHFTRFAEYIKLKLQSPKILIVKGRQQKKYLYSGSAQYASFESIKQFLVVYEQNLLQQFALTEQVGDQTEEQL